MALHIRVQPASGAATFDRADGRAVIVGRGAGADVRVGHERVGRLFTVSKAHVELRWDGSRWRTRNISDKPGLLAVYEPGYEEVPLEPGRTWVPARHRWSYSLGQPDHRFHVICSTDDHHGPASAPGPPAPEPPIDNDAEDEPTAAFEALAALVLTALERDVLLAYYGDFAALPRPPILEPRSHDDAAHHLGRTRDSTRKAIERVNDKIGRVPDAPPIATGRNVSAEIGRWLARAGLIDPW